MKLQNNFTTPEQSKRLLELGVPADSADCMNFGNADIFQIPFQRPFSEHLEFHVREDMRKMYAPCWSVGRLIEIMLNSQIDTGNYTLGIMLDKDTFNIEFLIYIIDKDIKEFDFSKLEEYNYGMVSSR